MRIGETILKFAAAAAVLGAFVAPAIADPVEAWRMIYASGTTFATGTGTTEQTAFSYSLPANTLVVAGQHVKACASFTTAGNSNNKTVKVYFGSVSMTSGTLTDSGKNGWMCVDAYRSGSKTQAVYGASQHDTTMVTPFVNAAATEDDTAAIVVKVTAQDGSSSAADITINDFVVWASV